MSMTTDEVRSLPAAVTVPQACDALGVSTETGYAMANRGEMGIRCGRRIVVPKTALLAMLQIDEAPAAATA